MRDIQRNIIEIGKDQKDFRIEMKLLKEENKMLELPRDKRRKWERKEIIESRDNIKCFEK